MEKKSQQLLAEALKAHLDESEKIWNEKNPDRYPFLIGYLQGTIKVAIRQLDDKIVLK